MPDTMRVWDAVAGEWRAVPVEIPAPPRKRSSRRRTRRDARPLDLSGLSAGAPVPAWWRDTAFAPGDPLADMRSWVKPAAMRTHRAAAVMPADPGALTALKPSDRLDK